MLMTTRSGAPATNAVTAVVLPVPKSASPVITRLMMEPNTMAMMIATLFYWFGEVIRESQAGQYNRQVDISFRMGMVWFIFSEVMFFAAFFGALLYARQFSIPWLGGEGVNILPGGIGVLELGHVGHMRRKAKFDL